MLGRGLEIYKQSETFGGFVGLLDQPFAQGAAAAYSLRLLRAKHSGGLVRVRADDSGTDKGEADVLGILQPDGSKIITLESPIENFSGTPFSGDGYVLADLVDAGGQNFDGFVSKWYGQSPNKNDAIQSGASQQPKIVDSGTVIQENGTPAVKKEKDGQSLESANLVIDQPTSYAIVAQSDNSNDSGAIFDGLVSRQHVFSFIEGDLIEFFAGTARRTKTTPAGQNLLGIVFDSANGNSLFTLNRTTVNKDPGSNRLEHLILFSNSLFNRKGNIKIQEFIAFEDNKDTDKILKEQNKHYQSPNF